MTKTRTSETLAQDSIEQTLHTVVVENDAQRMTQSARQEARRIMQICNACRYCEGFCSVFPAMTQHRDFDNNTLDYLANLCHNCRGCYYACQYAEPHEFNVNVPKTFNELRVQSWQDHTWPQFMARAFAANGLLLSLAFVLVMALVLIGGAILNDIDGFFHAYPDGDFGAIIPHSVMVAVAGPVFLLALLMMGFSGWSFWRTIKKPGFSIASIPSAVTDTFTLKNLSGGGYGCNDHSARFSMVRRYLHQSTFYGFLLCFSATAVGTIYHYVFGWEAPHDYLSLPVILGTVGGIALCVGTVGLYVLKLRTEKSLASPGLWGMEAGFIVLLFMTSLTGLLLLCFRETAAMGTLLAVHLSFVLTLFLFLPYSKMVHGMYRFLALLRFHH